MRILIVSDAAAPQINGVVRTLENTVRVLESRGFEVRMISPKDFRTFALPMYREIQVPLSTKGLEKHMTDFDPDFVHISTEGRLGWAARKICNKLGWRFTTAYHTDFPQYLWNNFLIPKFLTYSVIRRFHSAAAATMVATPTVEEGLRKNGFRNLVRWSRGVDTTIFYPLERTESARPILLNVGRVSKEKNLEAFCELDIDAKKVVVGSGPMLDSYRAFYPDVVFEGKQTGAALAKLYNSADCFVFPSRTDTFGLVIVEALACGTPVAAYPVQGPLDILTDRTGAMDKDLKSAVEVALTKDRSVVAQEGAKFSWESATEQFLNGLVPR